MDDQIEIRMITCHRVCCHGAMRNCARCVIIAQLQLQQRRQRHHLRPQRDRGPHKVCASLDSMAYRWVRRLRLYDTFC